jgi:hypothetical protein
MAHGAERRARCCCTGQVLPYVRYAKEEPDGIGAFLRGIIKRYHLSVISVS